MNVKKLAIIGAIALVVFGCVIAAGCTSTTTQQTQTSETTSNNPWVGLWTSEYKYADGTVDSVSLLINKDGTAIWTDMDKTTDNTVVSEKNSWKHTGNNNFTLTSLSDGINYNYTYDAAKDTLTENDNGIINVYTRSNPILGTWGTLCKDVYGGNEITTFLADGTGKDKMQYLTGETEDRTFTWTKTGLNTYKLTYDNGDVWQVKIIDDEEELDWKVITLKDQILGTRTSNYEENGKKITDQTTFKEDFTGVSVGNYADVSDNKKITDKFTWKKIGPNTYLLSYEDGTKWVGVYNKKDNTVNYTLNVLSAEPIVGTHKVDETELGVDGTTVTTFNPNGTGKEVQTTKAGLSETYDFIWKKTDTKNTYTTIYYDKDMWEIWTESYNPQTKTLDSKLEYYLWDDNYRVGNKHRLDVVNTSLDNTGTSYEYDANGDMKEYKFKWEEIKTNVYKTTYDDGDVWYSIYSPLTDTYEWKHSL